MAKQSLGLGSGVPFGVELKEVQGYDGKYWAGSDGHIYCYSDARVNAKKPRPFRMLETIGSEGYPFVAFIFEGRRVTKPVHRLVCEAFHGPPPLGAVVRHLDGGRATNCPANLAWGSYADNEADKRRHGRVAKGCKHGAVKLTEEGVRIIRASVPFGLWNAKDAAAVFGVDAGTIRNIANGKGWHGV